MTEAFLWGALAASSLVIGGVVALAFRVSGRVLGLILAFGAGVLISAVAYELVEEAFATSRRRPGSPPGSSRAHSSTSAATS